MACLLRGAPNKLKWGLWYISQKRSLQRWLILSVLSQWEEQWLGTPLPGVSKLASHAWGDRLGMERGQRNPLPCGVSTGHCGVKL